MTSYNPEGGQTDSSPCIAAGGHDICALARKGIRTLAVSRDLRSAFLQKKGQYFIYPAQVFVESDDPSIQGCYLLTDTMNARFTNRIDLFFLNRKDNQVGEAVISNKIENCPKIAF